MISFNKLGNLGRLGNQMFQYAAIKGIAANHGYQFCIPPKDSFGLEDKNVLLDINNTIYDVFELGKFKQGFCNHQIVQETTHSFDKNLYSNCPDNIDLLGYFQTHKYFKNIESEIRKDFIFKKQIKKVCEDFLESRNYISIHVRRGDYVNLQHYHPLQSLDYYEKALEWFPENIPAIIFSDDPQWCKQQELFSSDRFIVSENNETSVDLCLMSMCYYHIIANSSLSWWGSWLANSLRTVAPKNWFVVDQGISTKDKYLEKWIVI
jgi:hypothetical protein